MRTLESSCGVRTTHSVPRTLKPPLIMGTTGQLIGVESVAEYAQVAGARQWTRLRHACREAYTEPSPQNDS